MRRVVLGLAVAGIAALPASAAGASEIPPINCGIVSCTYPIEKKLNELNELVAQEEADLRECVQNGIGAIQNILQGTPQPGVCNL